jgi:hypothetical protein
MLPRARRLLLLAALSGVLAGCAHRPPPPPTASTLGTELALPTAADPAPATRRSLPGTPFTRAHPDEALQPLLVLTPQVAHGDLFLHTLTGTGPRYQAPTRLHRGQRAFILPFARNYAFDALQHCDLTFEVTIHKPDGTLDGAPLSASLWQDEAASPGLLLYPATTVSFHAEPADPLGEYRFVVRVHDHLADETVQLERTLLLEDYAPPALPADFDPDRWFHAYYLDPAPELALPALPRFFAKLPAHRRAGAVPPLLGFYDQILTDNPWLLPAFAARLAAAGPDEAFALSLVLGFHLRALDQPPTGIEPGLWARLADFRTHTWPADPDSPLLHAAQLDALWGRFFASALYAPVGRLLEPLANTADLGATERWRSTLPPPEPGEEPPVPDLEDPATPPELRREVLLRTALWSLRANARQHPLVRGYLEQTLRAGDLPPGARILLERAVRADPAPHPAPHPATAAAAAPTG